MVRAGQLLRGEGSLSWKGGTFSSKPQLPGPASLPAFATVRSLQVCGEKTATLRCCLSILQLTSLLMSRVRTFRYEPEPRMPTTTSCLVSPVLSFKMTTQN